MTRPPLRVLLAITLLLFTSCVNYEEHFTITASGAGSIRAFLLFKGKKAVESGEKLGDKLKGFIGDAPGLDLAHYSSQLTSNNVRVTEFTIAFDHVKRLQAIGESEEAADVARFFGSYEVEKLSDRYSVTRTVDLTGGFGSFNPEEQGNIGRKITDAVLSNYNFQYHMHFPTEVLESNGTVSGEENKSSSWSLPLSDIVANPVAMKVDIHRPPVGMWITLAAAGLLVPAGAAGYWWMRRRKSGE